VRRARETRHKGPNIDSFLGSQAELEAEIGGNLALNREVVLELVVVLDHFVTAALESMDERAGALGFLRLTLRIGKEVGTVLAGAEGASQSVAVTHLKPV